MASRAEQLESSADPPLCDDAVGFFDLAGLLVRYGCHVLCLIVAVPVLGHASWHAYRDLLDVSELPERLPAQGWH